LNNITDILGLFVYDCAFGKASCPYYSLPNDIKIFYSATGLSYFIRPKPEAYCRGRS